MDRASLLIIGYNRPDIARQTFDWIKKACPRKVYFAIDGPATVWDAPFVEKVKSIFLSGIPDAECYYYINESNLGPELTISNAISKVFEREDRVIILEDDVVAPPSFLHFADLMLERYADDDRIAMITGSNFINDSCGVEGDYFFGYSGSTLSGWATWKRAWKMFDLNEKFKIERSVLKQRFPAVRQRNFYCRNYRVFSMLPHGSNTWDCCWQFERIKENTLSIIPRFNLTSNIGTIGTHFQDAHLCHLMPINESFVVSEDPEEVKCNDAWERQSYATQLSSPLWKGPIINLQLLIRVLKIWKQWK